MTVRVRPGTSDDIAATTEVLIRAFTDDPFMEWMVGGGDFAATMRATLDPQLRRFLRRGGLDVAVSQGAVVGAALWVAPGSHLGFLTYARMAIGLIRHRRRHVGWVRAGFQMMSRATPPQPLWHLDTIGADTRARGMGVGSALIEHRLPQIDMQQLPVYLESTKRANIGFYQRFGFAPHQELTLPHGPVIYTMLRSPAESLPAEKSA